MNTKCTSQECKARFQAPVVTAYYDVEKIFALEKQIQELKSAGASVDQIEELQKQRAELQKKIDEELNDGGLYRSFILKEYESMKNSDCGHSDRTQGTEECVKCKQCKELLAENINAPEKWIQDVIPMSRFTVLIFYRGTWCGNCAVYLQEVNHIIRTVRALGGEAYGVCSQEQKYINTMKNDTQIDYELLSDTKNVLAKMYDIKTSKKGGRAFRVMSRIILSAMGNTGMYEPYHEDGIVQPGIVVISNKGDVIYRWTTPARIKTGFGMFERADPKDVLEILQFYYSQPTLATSVLGYVQQNEEIVFEMTLTNMTLHDMFMKHLKKEFAPESLEFIDNVDEFAQMLEKNKKKKAETKEVEIYKSYFPEDAQKALNIPAMVRRRVTEVIIDKQIALSEHVYHDAYLYVRNMLQHDNFKRFVQREEFINSMIELIPKTYFTTK
jgi:hypothetical protein